MFKGSECIDYVYNATKLKQIIEIYFENLW